MNKTSVTNEVPGKTKFNLGMIKSNRTPMYFYLSGIVLAALFIVPAAFIQTFIILESNIVLEGKVQWHLFIMPLAVITIAGLMIGRIRLLSHLLKQSNEQQQRELLNNTSSVVYMKDMEGRYTFINRQFEKLFNLSNEDFIGKTDYDILPKDKADNFRRNDRMAIEADRTLEFDETVHQDDGEHTYLTVKFPLKDASGEVYASCGISTDITERINMEEALRRSQKMDAIGQLTGGIAHDFNNQLGIIAGYLEFLKDYSNNDEKPLKWIETAGRATQRCVDLTQQLLSFSRSKAKNTSVLDLNETFKEMDNILSHSVTPEVEIQYFLDDNLWRVETDAGELQDVIINLVINARDAMPHGGKLVIETSNKKVAKEYSNLSYDVKAGDYVQIKLSDTGTGMDKETLKHLYEPFYTTKPEGKGTGLGLAMVYGFIERYDGFIEAHSEPGVGTSFHLYLPRSVSSRSVDTIDDSETGSVTGNESILIVDDEVDLLQLASEHLSTLGYRVYEANNAGQALAILSAKNIDLLFSDVVMPGDTNGYKLAQQATQQRPDLKVLLTSGYTSKVDAKNGLARFSANLLNKPYHKTELAQRVRKVLDIE